jgi:5-methylcytosine-specific restriction endonuclease McrA
MSTCTRCGASFAAPSRRTGRPRSRCDECRTNHDRIGGTRWRKLRAQVLQEEPACCIPDCGRPSSQVDHIIPLSKAPSLGLERSNVRGICATHNASKGDRPAYRCKDPLCPEPETCPGRWHL